MRGILTFIGGLAVGILAVTGVYAMDEDEDSKSIDCDEELELEEELDDDEVDDDAIIMR